jgi:hypothetical protein
MQAPKQEEHENIFAKLKKLIPKRKSSNDRTAEQDAKLLELVRNYGSGSYEKMRELFKQRFPSTSDQAFDSRNTALTWFVWSVPDIIHVSNSAEYGTFESKIAPLVSEKPRVYLPPLFCDFKRDGSSEIWYSLQDQKKISANINEYRKYLPKNADISCVLKHRTDAELKAEVRKYVLEACRYAWKMGARIPANLDFKVEFERMGRGEGSVTEATFAPATRTIAINTDSDYLANKSAKKMNTVYHETIHYLAHARQGIVFDWRQGRVKNESRYNEMQNSLMMASLAVSKAELDSLHREIFADTLLISPKLRDKYRKIISELPSAARIKKEEATTKQRLAKIQKLIFDAKPMQKWLEEGATEAITLDMLGTKGFRPWNYTYTTETEVAKELERSASPKIFYNAYFSGDFGLIARAYCKAKNVTPDKFYAAFGFENGKFEDIGAEEALKRLRALGSTK